MHLVPLAHRSTDIPVWHQAGQSVDTPVERAAELGSLPDEEPATVG